ncbi:hypothetical protein NSP_4120 [Nodularia spumigena CCY9414]|nr:hypothetical protein NSP_4120 [Nodularia spumigena CCY9414]
MLTRQKADSHYIRLSLGRINFPLFTKCLIVTRCLSTGLALPSPQKTPLFD